MGILSMFVGSVIFIFIPICLVLIFAKNKMSALGWILSVIGAIVCIGGVAAKNDAERAGYGYYQYIDNSDKANAEVVIAVGALILVFGIVFIIVGYLRNPSKKINVSQNTDIKSSMMMCKRCNAAVPVGSKFCTVCGSSMDTEIATGEVGIRCKRCGSVNHEGNRFCPSCGNDLHAEIS